MIMIKKFKITGIIALFAIMLISRHASAELINDVPVTTDSRIKTLVYSENEVYRLVLQYGYQTYIELPKDEEIQTVSLGDPYAWKMTPAGNRLFIRPQEEAAHTNMTLITSKHAYQFDLQSKMPDDTVDEDLAYVVRFYYPPASFDAAVVPGSPIGMGLDQPSPLQPAVMMNQGFPNQAMPYADPSMMNMGMGMPQPQPAAYLPPASMQSPQFSQDTAMNQFAPQTSVAPMPMMAEPIGSKIQNLNYTLSGPDSIAPVKIWDDGQRTYFIFPNNNAVIPYVYGVNSTGSENLLTPVVENGAVVVNTVQRKFILRLGNDVVTVYNENPTVIKDELK